MRYVHTLWVRFQSLLVSVLPLKLAHSLLAGGLCRCACSKGGYPITYVTAYNDTFSELGDIVTVSAKEYCFRHGYGYAFFKTPNVTGRAYVWTKILVLYDVCRTLKHEADAWVLWVDADACIVSPEFDPVRQIIRQKPHGTEIIIAKDINGINLGVMLLKNTPFVRTLLRKIWSMRDCLGHCWQEQQAFVTLLEHNWNGLSGKISFEKQAVLNAYTYSLHPKVGKPYPEGELCRESFIYHVPDLPLTERAAHLRKVLDDRR